MRKKALSLAMILTAGLLPVSAQGPATPRQDALPAAPSPSASGPPARVVEDWKLQDGVKRHENLPAAVEAVLKSLGEDAGKLRDERDGLAGGKIPSDDARWEALYLRACQARRAQRLGPYLERIRRVVFTKHADLGGSHYAYTEALSDGQGECHWLPGSALCVLAMDGPYGTVETLLEDSKGMIRDPDVSYEGDRILFAWKKSQREDDFHLYEMAAGGDASGKIRQLTDGLGFADYEAAYLPDGRIIFNSTRCVQTVDCFPPTVSNLFFCDGDGRSVRRAGFDQVHTNYPAVTPDGRIIFTRWEYSDRGQIYVQSLFQMNPDGTGQTELYGNNSFFPTSILHARMIPGSQKYVGVFSGHHSRQRGKLGIIDPGRGRQENQGAYLIAPVRETRAERVDKYGQDGEQFQYPYPLDENAFLVTYKPGGSRRNFALYFMTADGGRELLAWDDRISCNQPVPLAPRSRPAAWASPADGRKDTGTYYLQDIYRGGGLEGVPRGTIKALRVVAIAYRPVHIGQNNNHGPAGGALVTTPIAIGGGAWDPKIVLGSATVHEDGSACFTVPAQTPVYFQALDANGHAVQSMRSWSTLQPGETFACVGCHEDKNTAPPVRALSAAMRAGPQSLQPFYGPPRGFSFPREIQPILDKHCNCCHNDRQAKRGARSRDIASSAPTTGDSAQKRAFSLLGEPNTDPVAKRTWSDSYLALTNATTDGRKGAMTGQQTELVNWINAQSAPPMLPPRSAGAARSRLISMLAAGHNSVKLSREDLDKLACWIDLLVPYCGDYLEANAWSDEEIKLYDYFLAKRKKALELQAASSTGGE